MFKIPEINSNESRVLEKYYPEHNTDDTIRAMIHYATKYYVDKRIQSLAEYLISEIHPSDKTSQMIAILNWIKSNMIYVNDGDEANRMFGTKGDLEMVKSPISTLETKRYDCDCIATFIASLLMALGIKVRLITVAFSPEELTGPDGFEHVYAVGYDDSKGKWIIIDPVSNPNERSMIKDTMQHRVYDVN